MDVRFLKFLTIISVMVSMTACSMSPTYINESDAGKSGEVSVTGINSVHFKFAPEFHQQPPKCVAVLPLKVEEGNDLFSESEVKIDEQALINLRRALYSHLSPYPYRDVELGFVDKKIAQYGQRPEGYNRLGKALSCDTLLVGEVFDYDTQFFGVYSQTSVGVKLKLLRASDNKVLWQGRHVAASHGGSIPLTPVDIAMGLYSATNNISDEQIVRVGDDLFRRLLVTWDKKDGSETFSATTRARYERPKRTYYVTARQLNLRTGPGMQYDAEIILKKDATLALVNERHIPWLQVKMDDGRLGYVHERYVLAR